MQAILYAVLAGLCWGVGEIFTKSVLRAHVVGPMTVLLVRALVGVPPAVLVYWLATRVSKAEATGWLASSDAGFLAKLFLGSALLAGFGGVFFFYQALAQSSGDISKVKPIAFTLAPAIAVLLGWLVLGEPMTLRKGIGVVMILGGVVVVAGAKSSH